MSYFVIIPELILTGPTKGAAALANGLVFKNRIVHLIVLKGGYQFLEKLNISKSVNIHILKGSKIKKLKKFKNLVYEYRPKFRISMGFSADVLNFLFKAGFSKSISSVRANLFINYYLDYGFSGKLLAFVHYKIISKFEVVLSMTESMKLELKSNLGIDSALIGNFIDEAAISKLQKKGKEEETFYFSYVGTLSERKNVIFLIESFINFSKSKSNVKLLIAGDGPLKEKVTSLIENFEDKIEYLGFIDSPYDLLAKSHVFVLLSSSEGMSRAALEALFLGNIGLLSMVEGNSELIEDGENGYLYDKDIHNIEECFEKSYHMVKNKPKSIKSHIPDRFNQNIQVSKLVKLLENHVQDE